MIGNLALVDRGHQWAPGLKSVKPPRTAFRAARSPASTLFAADEVTWWWKHLTGVPGLPFSAIRTRHQFGRHTSQLKQTHARESSSIAQRPPTTAGVWSGITA